MKNLKFFRNFFSLTQKEIADKLNIDEHTIKFYESVHSVPTFKNLKNIIELFNITYDFFILFDKCKYPRNIKLLTLAKKLDDFSKSEARNNIEATTRNLLG